MKNKFFKKALSVFTAMAMALSLMTGIPFSELGLGITVSAEETIPDFSTAKVLTVVDGTPCIDGEALTINTDQFGDFNVIIPEGNYKLTGNIATDIYIFTEGSINLDLNGYTWDMSGKYFRLKGNATLSLYDTSVNKTGKITTSSHVCTIDLRGSGSTFNLYSGTVENTSDAEGVSCLYGSSNLYGGTIKSNAYAVFYYLSEDITINIDNTSFDCGDGYAQIFASLSPYGEPCAVIDVSDYTGGALTVDAKIDKAGKIKIFTGIQSAQDAENYKINFRCDDNNDFFEEKQEYEADGGNKYVYVSVPSFTTQPTEENDYTVAFNHPDATLQWCEVTVYDSATYSEEDEDRVKSYEVNAGDALIVSLSECSDDFYVDFDCIYNEESLYMSLDSSRKTASVTFDSEGTVDVNCMPSSYGTGEYKMEHVRYTELNGETDVQLSKTECETTYRCKATLGETVYYSDELTIEQEHSYTCTATSANVITKECANCGKSGTLTITAEGGIYDGTTAYGATVIKTGILENEEVTVDYYQGDTLIGTDAPVNAGTYTAKITYEEVTASVTYTINATPTADMFTYIESAVYDGTAKSANVVVKDGITGVGEIANIKYYQNDVEVTPINAGTYTVKIDVAKGDLFDAATDIEVGTFTINKATPPALTIPTATSITYGDTLSSSVLSDSSWAWVDGTIIPNTTNHNAYIEVDDSNYDYTSVYGYDSANHRVVRDITVIINRATLTITANSYTIKVGSALPTYDYTVTGLVGNDTLPVDVTISCSATDSNAVGAYTITISGVVSDAPLASHYVINYVNGKLTITEKDIQEIAADDVILTYGETKNIGATTNGDGAITYSTTSDVISIAADGTITALKAGTATVTINAAETDNYAAATKTVTVTVNKKKVAVPTADTTEYTYTGTAQTYGVTSTDDYTVEGGVQTNAGEYPITITLNNENYEWDGTLGTYKFVINKAAVTVTAKSYTIKVGDTLPTYAYDVAGLVNGETLPIDVTISCNAADSNTAGTYTITVSGAANSTNYTFAYVNGTLTISNKLEQTITASNVTLTYGETGKKITATTSGDGAISYSTTSDVISVAADGTITALKAGTATVTINVAETDTYAAATKTVTVTVNKAAVTVTAKSYTIKVGETLPTYAYDVAGLVNGETLPIDVTISCNAADSNTAGTYDIIVSGAATSDNYTFSYVKGTLTVSEKEVVATPTFTPASGTTFTSSQKVTISCATAGAKIYYTTDGTEPTTASTLYNGAFTITTTTTIKAIAVKDGMTDSAVASITFTKNEYRPPVYPSYPIVTTTTTTTTTPAPVDDDEIIDEDIDDDSDDEDIEIDEDTDTTKPVDDGDEPQIKGEDDKTGWDVIADEIADADDGDKIVVDMNGTTEVPEDILEQIQGQDIDLVIELDNGFTWTINGESVTEPMDIDLGVNEGATIPVKVINEVTGECSYITITLTHNGEFGFTAVLTVDMGDENEGLYANLYWYTSGNTEFICADKINNKGKAALTFTHASEYIIVIDETNHGKRVEESDDADEDADSDVDNIFNGEEDDDVNPFTAVTISFTGVIISAAAVVLTRKRKNK